MSINPFDRDDLVSTPFGEFTGYEKGAIARAFLHSLVKQESIVKEPDQTSEGEVTIAIRRWQFELLAEFYLDVETLDDDDEDEDDEEILLENLLKLR